MDFYAHSTTNPARTDWQALSAHLQDVAELAAKNAAHFGGQALARPAGLLHDIGKYTHPFQTQRLQGLGSRIDHATHGAVLAQERYPGYGALIAYAVAGHHAGLANGDGGTLRSSLKDRLSQEYRAGLAALLPHWENEISLPTATGLPEGFEIRPERGAFQLTLLTRMIFSCLVDADFVDTDDFYRRIEHRKPRPRGDSPSLQALRDRLDAHLAALPGEGAVNRLRGDILRHVRAQASRDPGLFSLTVPTGGGKTLASLAFALDHAIAHGLRRVIYVIPFTSIVEQNAQVFRKAFGDLGDAVLEHHSAFSEDPRSAPEGLEKRRLAMENWDAPVVVTTAVQFFESLFADRPSRCRKLHNIAGSVVILDEAQTMPLDFLRPCVAVLDELALNYRASPVLCTATQPALLADQGFKSGLTRVRELAPDPPALYAQLRRTTVRHVGTLDDTALERLLRDNQQMLCIVNNRRHARHAFETIANEPGACHLTTLMYAHHRRSVLHDVRKRLQAGAPCRLVSTSLIEAGVDVDFPIVLRAEAGLDSIAQAAGRCNREGRRSHEASEVLVFEPLNRDWAPPRELKVFADVFRSIERQHRHDLLALDALSAYFQQLYWRLDQGLDRKDLLGLLRGASLDSLPFETLAAEFRMIETAMKPVIVPFEPGTQNVLPEVARAVDDLAYAPAAARQLQPYLVQVPQRAYDALWRAHALEVIAPEHYGQQFVRLVNPRLYDPRFGLHWDDPGFLSEESLVW